MSNVLPRSAQNRIWKTYRARFIVTASVFLLLGSLVGGLSLLPGYLTLYSGAAGTAEAGTREKSADRTELVAAQSLVVALAPVLAATSSPAEIIGVALAARPARVTVDHVSYTAGPIGTLMLVGSAGNRNQIEAYRQALTDNPHFDSVALPVNNLLGAEGGKFSITLTGHF